MFNYCFELREQKKRERVTPLKMEGRKCNADEDIEQQANHLFEERRSHGDANQYVKN